MLYPFFVQCFPKHILVRYNNLYIYIYIYVTVFYQCLIYKQSMLDRNMKCWMSLVYVYLMSSFGIMRPYRNIEPNKCGSPFITILKFWMTLINVLLMSGFRSHEAVRTGLSKSGVRLLVHLVLNCYNHVDD
jgi:hypothetical protein